MKPASERVELEALCALVASDIDAGRSHLDRFARTRPLRLSSETLLDIFALVRLDDESGDALALIIEGAQTPKKSTRELETTS